MKKLFLYIFVYVMIIAAPGGFAQTTSNSDFNPFPQMEQDQSNIDADTAAASRQQNDENADWPPVNNDAQTNSDGEHD